jgi:hypothetical protein
VSKFRSNWTEQRPRELAALPSVLLVSEVGLCLAKTPGYVRDLVHSGQLYTVRLGPQTWRIPKVAVLRFLEFADAPELPELATLPITLTVAEAAEVLRVGDGGRVLLHAVREGRFPSPTPQDRSPIITRRTLELVLRAEPLPTSLVKLRLAA